MVATIVLTKTFFFLSCCTWLLLPSSIQSKMEKMAFQFGASNSRSKKIRSMKTYDLTAEFSALIVDDDAIVRKVHKSMLSRCGFETRKVDNGKEAVDQYRSGKCFDLVLMDMEMPVMDGPKATEELRAMGVSSMIIGVTSRGLESEKQAFIGAGLNACYEKPITAQTIASLLQMLKEKN